MMRALRIFFPALFAGTFLVFAPLPGLAQDAAPAAPATVVLPAITVSTVVMDTLTDRVLAAGLVGPVERVLVQPQIEGQAIDAIEVEVGDRVTKGQVLARLSGTSLGLQKSQLIASRASAEATIAQGEAQLIEAGSAADEAVRVRGRTLALAEAGSGARAAADTASANATAAAAKVTVASQGLVAAQAQLTLVDAQIANVDLNLERTLVTAPVAGEIIDRNAMVGAIASGAGAPMFTVIRDGLLELNADVAEQDILRLAKGQKVVLRAVGLPTVLTGTVRLVEPTVDELTRLGRVRITIDESGKVRSGMFADADIMIEQKQALAVPISAVGGGAAGSTVLRVRDGVAETVDIVTGIRDGGLIEVVGGLAEGDLVVTKAGAFVRSGDHINPVMADAAAISN